MNRRGQGRVDRMKTGLMLAGLALTMGGLVGCGGDDDGIPRDASTEEFCGNFQDLYTDLGQFGEDADPEEAIDALQDAADRIRETGVPESASDDEAEGLEVTLDAIDSLDSGSSLDDITNLEDTLSESEQEKGDAFDDYLDKECEDLG